jgi:hypothetical protein
MTAKGGISGSRLWCFWALVLHETAEIERVGEAAIDIAGVIRSHALERIPSFQG